ncbi:MAG: hypothetical protein JNK66_05060 [Chitinophagales bacterium]|nr:hypothetical protein [Chitinophagales bacterium]
MHIPDMFPSAAGIDWSAVFIQLIIALFIVSSITMLTAIGVVVSLVLAGVSVMRKTNSIVAVFRKALSRISLIVGAAFALCLMFLAKLVLTYPFWIIAICSLLLIPIISMLFREAVLFIIWKRFRKLIYFFRALKLLVSSRQH